MTGEWTRVGVGLEDALITGDGELEDFYVENEDTFQDWLDDGNLMEDVADSGLAMTVYTQTDTGATDMAASETAMDPIAASETAMDMVLSSEVAIDSVSSSETAMDPIAASEIAMDQIAASEIAMDTVSASETAMDAVASSETAMEAVTTSETAMNTVADSELAMDAVADSELAMSEVADSETAINKVVGSEMAMNEVSASSVSIEAVVQPTYARTKILWSDYYLNIWESQEFSEALFDEGEVQGNQEPAYWEAEFDFSEIDEVTFHEDSDHSSSPEFAVEIDGTEEYRENDNNGEVTIDTTGYSGELTMRMLGDEQSNIYDHMPAIRESFEYSGEYAISWDEGGGSSYTYVSRLRFS